MNSDELIEFEGRQYVNPDISRDEQTDFINTLRDIQAQNNAQIATETHNLGTDIDHPRGGLNGSEEYWRGLYQTPQTEAAVANMKAVAQQTALNNALTNYQNALQNRYDQAYRNYQKRQYKYNTTPRYTTPTTTNPSDDTPPVDEEREEEVKITTEGIASNKMNSIRMQLIEDGWSPVDALKEAMENWNKYYQKGSRWEKRD